MEKSSFHNEENPIFNIKPFSDLTKKHDLIKIEPHGQVPDKEIIQRIHDEEEREASKSLLKEGKTYAKVVKENVENVPEVSSQTFQPKKIEHKHESSSSELLEKVGKQSDIIAEQELPSYTELRGTSLDYEKEEPETHDLPTMDQERESSVEEELKWEKEHGMLPDKHGKPDLFDLHEVLNYIDQHRHVLEEGLSEVDKQRIKLLMDATKGFKSLCEETIHHFRDDIIEFYKKTKSKFSNALSEITESPEKSKI